MNSIIKLEQINKEYNSKWNSTNAIKKLNLNIYKGEMIAIMGSSGCGKTTLLKIIGCLDREYTGDYSFNQELIKSMDEKKIAILRNKEFGYIPQNLCLIEDETVEKNVLLPLVYRKNKIPLKNRDEKLKRVLDKLGIINKKNNLIYQLSGGERQRVAIARALINEPQVIIADEPTSALDRKTSMEIMQIFKDINKEGKTLIIVTHDSNTSKYCDKIVLMEDGIINELK